jgi:hypothetical protein
MHPSPGNTKRYLIQLYKQTKDQAGCMAILAIGIGLLLLLIPVVGWVAGPIAILLGVVTFFSPVYGRILLQMLFDREECARQKKIAEICARNAYDTVMCPSCTARLAKIGHALFWNTDHFGSLKCPSCDKTIVRVDDVLLCIPYPDVQLGKSFEEFISPAEHSLT